MIAAVAEEPFYGPALFVDPANCGEFLTCNYKFSFNTTGEPTTFGGNVCIPAALKDSCKDGEDITLGTAIRGRMDLTLSSGAATASLATTAVVAVAGTLFA